MAAILRVEIVIEIETESDATKFLDNLTSITSECGEGVIKISALIPEDEKQQTHAAPKTMQ